MTLGAVVTAKNMSTTPIEQCLAAQTRRADHVVISTCGTADLCTPTGEARMASPMVTVVHSYEVLPDYGYGRRNEAAMKMLDTDFVCFPCADDSYHPDFIALMMAKAEEGADVVWCRWNEFPRSERFLPCDSTLGNIIIRRTLFEELGGFAPFEEGMKLCGGGRTYEGPNDGLRDAWLISQINERIDVKVAAVPEILYYHNIPFNNDIQATSWGRPVRGVQYAAMLSYTNLQRGSKNAAV